MSPLVLAIWTWLHGGDVRSEVPARQGRRRPSRHPGEFRLSVNRDRCPLDVHGLDHESVASDSGSAIGRPCVADTGSANRGTCGVIDRRLLASDCPEALHELESGISSFESTGMGAIEEIKGKIESLGEAEQAELRAWFIERDHMLWDKQIERDLEAGKLDALIAEAEADRRAGLGRAL